MFRLSKTFKMFKDFQRLSKCPTTFKGFQKLSMTFKTFHKRLKTFAMPFIIEEIFV